MRPWKMLAVLLLVSLSAGCASSQGVRYVYQDGNFGVVGMPENTDRWPSHFRHKAEKLMEDHFPDGHEIVRAEEVVEGERTLKVEGANTAEVAPSAHSAIISIAKLGRTSSRSQADTTKIKECRIIYRRIGSPEVPTGFASAADPTPTQYVDPNAAERHRIANGAAAKTEKDQPKASEQSSEPKPKADEGWGM